MAYRDELRNVEREGWWTLPRILLVMFVLMIVGFGFTFISDAFDLFSYKFWGVKQENARRQNYEATKSYHQGSIQRLNTLCMQVKDADNDHKVMINDTINHEFADWKMDDTPDYLQGCLARARQ